MPGMETWAGPVEKESAWSGEAPGVEVMPNGANEQQKSGTIDLSISNHCQRLLVWHGPHLWKRSSIICVELLLT